MKALRIMLAVLFALVALFAGGCSLAFTIPLLQEPESGLLAFLILPAIGYATAAGSGWLAWRFLKGPRDAPKGSGVAPPDAG